MVIVGAGHAGGRAAQALREFGWTGPVMMIGAEPHLPYERPPVSKGLLTGEQTPEHAPPPHTYVHAAPSFCHWPLASQSCGCSPVHRLLPGVQTPVHAPALQT